MLVHIYTASSFTYFILLKCTQNEKLLTVMETLVKKKKKIHKELTAMCNILYSKIAFKNLESNYLC